MALFRDIRTQITEYSSLIRTYWFSKKSLPSWLFIGLSLATAWLFVYLSVYMNQLSGTLYDHVEQKNKDGVVHIVIIQACVILISLVSYAIKGFVLSLAGFRWRQFLSQTFTQAWLSNKKYYHIKGHIDNPDQRISEDIKVFCTQSLGLVLVLFTEGLTFLAFIGVLWNFPHSFDFSLFGVTFSIPHYLALGSFLYAVVMNLILVRIGKPLIALDIEQEKKEADYRYTLVRMNFHSEEIAFYQGEVVEEKVFNNKLKEIGKNYYALTKRTFFLSLFQNGFSATLVIVPMLAALPLFFSDKITFGELMRITGAASNLLIALGVLISNYPSIATLQSAKNRLFSFATSLSDITTADTVSHNSEAIAFSNVSLANADQKLLIENLDFKLQMGKKLLIMGKSGIGKTSILRALAKIWIPQSGKVHLPEERMYFIPQRPYLPVGSLKNCLNYPLDSSSPIDDSSMAEALSLVGLGHLVEDLERERDYLKILSLGEMQRLNFAKILLHKPKILVMDEPTASLDEHFEKAMFHLLKSKLPDITIITVSHSANLMQHHDHMINISK